MAELAAGAAVDEDEDDEDGDDGEGNSRVRMAESEYERERKLNIAANDMVLAQLGLTAPIVTRLAPEKGKKTVTASRSGRQKPRAAPEAFEFMERRRSSRLTKKDDQDVAELGENSAHEEGALGSLFNGGAAVSREPRIELGKGLNHVVVVFSSPKPTPPPPPTHPTFPSISHFWSSCWHHAIHGSATERSFG